MRLDGSRSHFTRNSSNKNENENEWNTENPIEILCRMRLKRTLRCIAKPQTSLIIGRN